MTSPYRATPLPNEIRTVVVGAGPAGLATSRELIRRGVPHVVLERGPEPAHVWANLYESLTLHTGRHMSTLPGMRMSGGVPLFPSRTDFVRYLREYARNFALPVRAGVDVTAIEPHEDGLAITTSTGMLRARSVVMATGIVSQPFLPDFPSRDRFAGRLIHSSEYRRPLGFIGTRVLVVGVGNSGGEIASELARTGAKVTVAVRSGANVVPRTLAGIPIQYLAYYVRKLPRPAQQRIVAAIGRMSEARRGPAVLPKPSTGPLDAIPLIGFHLVDAIRGGLVAVRPGIDAFTERGVRFTDGSEEEFDTVILATGFRAALSPLGSLVRRDAKGFALRADRVRSADHPSLFFVGHNYDASGGIHNIAVDAPLAASAIAAL